MTGKSICTWKELYLAVCVIGRVPSLMPVREGGLSGELRLHRRSDTGVSAKVKGNSPLSISDGMVGVGLNVEMLFDQYLE